MLTYGKGQIEWRRNRVLELSSQGHNQYEIAQTLQVAKGTVNADLAFLKKKAQENLQHHINELVPTEWQKAYTQLNQVLKKTWEIVDKTADERTRLQALTLIDQCNTHKMDMITNGSIITGALDYVNDKTKQLGSAVERKQLRGQEAESEESKESEELEEELEEGQEKDTGELEDKEEKTTNDVF